MNIIDKKSIDEKLQAAFPLEGRWHNRFHLEMPFGLINDPNGLTYYDGLYHIFYQWNPLGVEHKNKCWAHTTTSNFTTYSKPTLALWPSDIYDKDGCYSGAGWSIDNAKDAEENGVYIYYTGNSKNERNERGSAQRIGKLTPEGYIEKDAVLIPGPPSGYTAHFRDPQVFIFEGHRYMILGAQRESLQGCVLLYKEESHEKWQLIGELETDLPDFGYMWECPSISTIGQDTLFIFSPQGLAATPLMNQNRYQAGYLMGTLEANDKGGLKLRHGEFKELDKGFDFYAPQPFANISDTVFLGWIGMPEEEATYPTTADGWIHSLTVPRKVVIRDGILYSSPAKEITALRDEKGYTTFSHSATDAYTVDVPSHCDMSITLRKYSTAEHSKKDDISTVTLHFGSESLLFSYQWESQIMTIDRSHMKHGGKGTRTFLLPATDTLQMRLLLDTSILEVFFQDGLEVATVTFFPEEEGAPKCSIKSDSPVSITGEYCPMKGFTFI